MSNLIEDIKEMRNILTDKCQFITNMLLIPSKLQSREGRDRRRDLEIYKTRILNIRNGIDRQLLNPDITDQETLKVLLSQGTNVLDKIVSCMSWDQQKADEELIENMEDTYLEEQYHDYSNVVSSSGSMFPDNGLVNVGTDSNPKWITVEEHQLLANTKFNVPLPQDAIDNGTPAFKEIVLNSDFTKPS